jgi:plastocyanin
MNLSRAVVPALVPVVAALLLSAVANIPTDQRNPSTKATPLSSPSATLRSSVPTITIDRGTSVRWRSTTGTFHTVTPDGHQVFARGR